MKTILIVDDDRAVLNVVSRQLADRYRVLTAEDAQGALDTICNDRPDLVLLDLSLHGTSGGFILRAAHRVSPELPVALVTGAADPGEVEHSLANGAQGCLLKPFSDAELQRFVDSQMMLAQA